MLRGLSQLKRFALLIIVLATAAAGGSAYLLYERGIFIWLPFTMALPAAILHVAAAVVVWNGLNGFKAELRQAYKYICIAVVFVGFTQLQLPVISLFGLWELRENGLIIVPFVLPFIFFSIGIRKFTQLLGIKTRWASIWLVNGAGLVLGALLAIMPHAPNHTSPLAFAGTLVLLSWIAVHALALINMVLRIKRVIGASYVNAMAWLFVTYVAVLVTDVMYLITLMVTSPGNWYLDYNISIAPFIIVGLLWLRAGYAFNTVTAPEPAPNHLGSFFGPVRSKLGGTTSVDIIMHVVTLASSPKDIDPVLDTFRGITVNLAPGQAPPPWAEAQLADVYLKVEEYLISKDPLRTFTRMAIRQDIENAFPPNVLAKTFWPQVVAA